MSEWCRVKGHDDQHACGDCAYARGLADAAGAIAAWMDDGFTYDDERLIEAIRSGERRKHLKGT